MITEMISQDCVKQSKYGFYKFPKSLIADQRFSSCISNDAKILYMLFIDRLSLSKINGWIDKCGEVYIYYSVKNICKDLHCHSQKVSKLLNELEFDAEIICRKQQGQGKPNRIYPKVLEEIYPQVM